MSSHFIESKRTALILGVNGQDGSYLAECLIKSGWSVIGVGRQSILRTEIIELPIKYFKLDLSNIGNYEELLMVVKPDVIFHTAAVHGSSGFEYESIWKDSHMVNTLSLHATLEYIRKLKISPQVVYFGSSKMFGNIDGHKIDESSCKHSTCIYSITKNSSASLINYYRKQYDITASIIWLFNHDSLRRNVSYFLPKIVNILRQSISNSSYKEEVVTLDFWCDWGYAKEYMELLVGHYDEIIGHDFVLATGETVWAKTMVRDLFINHGLDFNNHIITQKSNPKKHESYWEVDISKFKNITGSAPNISNIDVCKKILQKT
jgi:GDPmannose 4,6-dehydratase